MMKYATAVALFVACGAKGATFDLPIEVGCGDKMLSGIGGVICPQIPSGPIRLKVKVPPTKGQLRILDCEQELTADGNPDDFNMQIKKTGWWLFRKTVRVLDKTPEIWLPSKDYTDCPIVVSVTGEGAGVHTAAIVYEPRERHDFVNLECSGGETQMDRGVGVCRTFEGARLRFSVKPDAEMASKSHLFVVGTKCGINSNTKMGSGPLNVDMPEGLCIVDAGMVIDSARYDLLGSYAVENGVITLKEVEPKSSEMKLKSRFLLIGENRSARKLDNPIMVRDGRDGVRVYKPQGATMMETDIYLSGEVLWRSGVRDGESYTLSPDKDNADRYKNDGKWPKNATACHTAYTDKFNSMSGSCYDLNNMREKPYYFR